MTTATRRNDGPGSADSADLRGDGPLRVLHVVTDRDRRGAQVFANDLAAALESDDVVNHVVALSPGRHDDLLPIEVLGPRPRSIGTLHQLRRLAARFDVVVAHGSSTLVACAVALFRTRVPFIYRQISDPLVWARSWPRRLRVAFLVRRAQTVVTLSEGAADIVCRHYWLPRGRIAVIPNGVPPDRFHAANEAQRHAARRRLEIPPDRTVIAYVGVLDDAKGVDMLLDVIGRLAETYLIVVGAGPAELTLRQRAEHVAPGRVRFTGPMQDPTGALDAADLCALLSRTECMPATLIEAGLCGLPVVATDVGSIGEIVQDEVTGLLVPVGDAEAAAAAIERCSTRDMQRQYGEAARTRCLERYAIGAVARQWLAALQALSSPARIRVLHVIDSLAPGGAETSLVAEARHLVAGGVDLHVLSLGQRLDLAAQLSESGAVLHTLERRGGRLNAVLQVRRVMRSVGPELVHTTLYEADVVGRIAARSMRVPVVSSIVNDEYSIAHWRESSKTKLAAAMFVDAATARMVSRFHFLTDVTARSVGRRLLIPRRKIMVIPRGRDMDALRYRTEEARQRARREIGFDGDDVLLLAIGRMEPQKSFSTLIKAASLIAAEHPTAKILIAGREGRSTPELHRLAKASPLEIHFLGHRTDVGRLLTAADVFCFPSLREGLGGVLIEALAIGCPIVATRIPTSVEVLTWDGHEVGQLVEPDDPADLAAGIQSVLSVGTDTTMTQRGRAMAEVRFSSKRIAESLHALYTASRRRI